METTKPPRKEWTIDALSELQQSLLAIAEENGKPYAMDLLKHGLKSTPMTRAQFDTIRAAINRVKTDD